MTKYLLLRDNKQSGPYTFDELKEKGLKAYDLVWIEGKSAAWRYPSEVEELSAFAPVVEEQPFDRFYKKPSQISNVHSPSSELFQHAPPRSQPSQGSVVDNEPSVRSGNTSVTPAAVRTSSNPTVAASILTGDTSSVPGKRIIYVTLPAGKTAASAREARETLSSLPAPESQPAAREIAPPLHEKYLPDHSTPSFPAATADVFEENTSQHSEDWRAGVELTPRRKNRGSRVGQSVVVGLTVVALLAAGIFIGLSLNKDSLGLVRNFSLSSSKGKPASANISPADHPSQPLAVNNLPPAGPAQAPPNKDSVLSAAPAETAAIVVSTPKTTAPPKEKSTSAAQKPQTTGTVPRDSSLLAVPAVHREASHRTSMSVEKVDKDVIRNNLSNLVSIGASGYTVGTFGGISELQLTVSNHSVYSLDLVVVEVQYIQANKKVFKTENLYFRSVAPGSALMQEAPKSTRGIKVQYKITLVNSKELGLSYSAL